MSRANREKRELNKELKKTSKYRKKRTSRSGFLWLILVVAAVAIVGVALAVGGSPRTSVAASVGKPAPDGTFTLLNGSQSSLGSFRGHPVLLWFVTTWCTSCVAGTAQMKQEISTLKNSGLTVLELENYADLGYPGASMQTFVEKLVGPNPLGNQWLFGVASRRLTQLYNPKGYLDIYYVIDGEGRITQVGSGPSQALGQVIQAADTAYKSPTKLKPASTTTTLPLPCC